MHRADPAARQPAHPIAVLVLNVARPIHRRLLSLPRPRSQSPLDSPFAPRQFFVSTCLHSKCPPCFRVLVWSPRNSAMRYGHFESSACIASIPNTRRRRVARTPQWRTSNCSLARPPQAHSTWCGFVPHDRRRAEIEPLGSRSVSGHCSFGLVRLLLTFGAFSRGGS